MKKIVMCAFVALTCQLSFAEQPPVVGLWEQLPAGEVGGSSANPRRIDIVFVDRKIDEDTRFNGLVDIGTKASVLCCVKVSKGASITLKELLKKYPWDVDTAEHLKKITGWRYIYEAGVVEPREQNSEMRKLVKNLSLPPALSPYSAPVISGKIPAAEIDKKFRVGDSDVVYSMRASQDKSVVSYRFLINGNSVILKEENFPD
ncbi:hypothetical protein [Burkholderia sp. F1]|uniref:hypothetical protein n=1 Tax=Burkholderia sp. F1 TaxID=3366817 RepID=UPI003D74836D